MPISRQCEFIHPKRGRCKNFEKRLIGGRCVLHRADVCQGCGGVYLFDTSVPSVVWNGVIRANGLPEYLCAGCVVREFAKRGESFTAELNGDDFDGLPIEVRVNNMVAHDAARISAENTALRSAVRGIISQMEEASAIAWAERLNKAIDQALTSSAPALSPQQDEKGPSA